MCLCLAGYLILREQMLGFGWDRNQLDWAANPLVRSTGVDRSLMPLVLLGRYLLLLVAPLQLSLDYGSNVIGWGVNWHQPYVYLGAATGLAWIIFASRAVHRCRTDFGPLPRAILFCLFSLALTYGMVSNAVLLIGTIFGERLMYLPSVFFIILATHGLSRLLRPAALKWTVILLASLGGLRSFTYARQWNDPLSLYLSELQDHPSSMHLHGLAAYACLKQGRYLEARAIADDCLRRLPDCSQSYVMCVLTDLKLHDVAAAEAVLRRVDRSVPPTDRAAASRTL